MQRLAALINDSYRSGYVDVMLDGGLQFCRITDDELVDSGIDVKPVVNTN